MSSFFGLRTGFASECRGSDVRDEIEGSLGLLFLLVEGEDDDGEGI